MTVYVDKPVFTTGAKKPRQTYAHMVASTLDELHEFAQKIGVKPHFFHKTPMMPHYDINAKQQAEAVQAGAKEISSRDLVPLAKAMK